MEDNHAPYNFYFFVGNKPVSHGASPVEYNDVTAMCGMSGMREGASTCGRHYSLITVHGELLSVHVCHILRNSPKCIDQSEGLHSPSISCTNPHTCLLAI